MTPPPDHVSAIRVFVVYGYFVALMAAPTVENTVKAQSGTFSVEKLDAQLGPYFEGRSEHATFAAVGVAQLDTTGVENLPG